jgi:hypothetical protein
MRAIALLGEILPVLGTVGLLGLWLYQQTQVERRAAELRKLVAARAVYQNYQANNAVFNAINELAGQRGRSGQRVRTFQTYNYELGLAAIERVLPPESREGIPPAPDAYDASEDVAQKMTRTQERLGLLQDRLGEAERDIAASADAARRTYLWCYVGLSLASLLGAVARVVDKLSTAS